MDLVVEGIGGMCPVQGYGTLDGDRFYFRFRHDSAQLYVGPADPEDDDDPWHEPIPDLRAPRLYAELHDVTGEIERGWLENGEAETLLHRLIGMLKPPGEWEHGTGQQQLAALVDAMVQASKDKPLVRRERPKRK